jgi:hypothetical protein
MDVKRTAELRLDRTLVIGHCDRFPIRRTCPLVQLCPEETTHILSAQSSLPPSGNEFGYAWPGLYIVCFDRHFDGARG